MASKSSLFHKLIFCYCKRLVYFSSDDGNIYAVDNEGQGKWKYQTGGEVRSSIAMIDGVLYFGSNYDYLYALQVPPMLNGDSGGRS